ncbi:thiolase domain-containing protein [Pseudonocardia sp. NPDC049635]|uniref:thiolase domain-containing protein n=1 Tax=Pseudonocardia sp. NPDC049635 TaxID=3155506 RepID=UPI003406EDF3
MTGLTHIIGWAHTRFGKLDHPDVEALIADVSASALADAELDAADVDAISVGVFGAGFSRQSFDAALVGAGAPELARIRAVRSENACATGSAALYAAFDMVAARTANVVLVVGAEKMTGVSGQEIGDILLGCAHLRTEATFGSFAGVFATLARQYSERYGSLRETLAAIAAKNHHNAVTNPVAHMRRDLGVDFCATVSKSNPVVADPLLRTDCSLVSDGAAAVVVTSPDVARAARRSVAISGRSQTNEPMALAARRDPLSFDGAGRAFRAALAQAASDVSELDLIETHDCFTMAELLQYEAFGLAAPGKGSTLLAQGHTARDGILPVNVSGGLKAKGHPIGATGVSQHVMAAQQLVGEAGEMQLPRAAQALVFNMGGAAVTNYATVLVGVR